MSTFQRFAVGLVVLALLPATAAARQSAARAAGALPQDQAVALTQGWAFLAQGDFGRAAERASAVFAADPRNVSALALAVEVSVARTGPTTGLDFYEQWLAGRSIEEPGVLRAIARAVLVEISLQSQNPRASSAALQALADVGDPEALGRLQAAAQSGGGAELRTLAAHGDSRAVDSLARQLRDGSGSTLQVIAALGESGRFEALSALAPSLKNQEPVIRAAAAEAIGKLNQPSAAAALRPLLTDPSGSVRVQAAGALLRLGDTSGLASLYELTRAPDAAGRLIAAQALASRPDAQWTQLVQELMRAREPEVRLGAATLMAEHDQAGARAVLDDLARDSNPAVRDEATRLIAEDAPLDLPTLRGLLRHSDRLVRIAAAGRLLSLTR